MAQRHFSFVQGFGNICVYAAFLFTAIFYSFSEGKMGYIKMDCV